MAVTVGGTSITFNDSSVQSTASGLIAGTSYVPVNGSTSLVFDNIPSNANEIVFVFTGSYTSGPSGSTLNARTTSNTVLSSFTGTRVYASSSASAATSFSSLSDLIGGGQYYWTPHSGITRITRLPSYSGVYAYAISSLSRHPSSYHMTVTGQIASDTYIKSLVWNPGIYMSGGSAAIYWNKG